MNTQTQIKDFEAAPSVYDFIQGQKDCREGVPADCEGSEEYLNGYSFEYEFGERVSAKSGWEFS